VKNDHIAYRYEILNLLGKGSFGQVCECFDHKKKEKIALKVIKNKPKFHHQAAIEVKVLHCLREHDQEDSRNIIRMKNYFSFRNHICITFELISINLYEFLRLNHFQGLSTSLIKCFAKQVLNALDYTSSLSIVHCDLKPENILLVNPQKAVIKLIDFGSSCFLSERLHTYIQSRFYRAPEIMLGIPYTCAIDIWSLGCILIELYTGQPLWPGECENDQLLHIISYLGMPPSALLDVSTRKSLFFENGKLKKKNLNDGKEISPFMYRLDDVVKSIDKDFLEFIEKCFEWDPEKRIRPGEALAHPWIVNKQKIGEKKAGKSKS
jgi:dual specificity tyrosine-phosphorylation-regulated kinase 2/3/4